MVPKIHSFRHCLLDFEVMLADPTIHHFPLCVSCEIGEDLIGRTCRLATTVDSRRATVLETRVHKVVRPLLIQNRLAAESETEVFS